MLRADYCGDGLSNTRDGYTIDVADNHGKAGKTHLGLRRLGGERVVRYVSTPTDSTIAVYTVRIVWRGDCRDIGGAVPGGSSEDARKRFI